MESRSNTSWYGWIIGGLFCLIVVWLVNQLATVLTPFITAAILAYILNPITAKLEKLKISRPLASLIVTLGGVALIFALLLIVIPMLISQAQALVAKLPAFIDFIQHRFLPWLNHRFDLSITLNADTWRNSMDQNSGGIRHALATLVPQITHGGAIVFGFLSNLMLLPLLLYYFLLDWQKMLNWVNRLIPHKFVPALNGIFRELDHVLGEFLRGQISVMLIMAVIYGGGLAMAGLDSGLAIGIVAGLLVFIPYLGAFIGLTLATLAGILQFPDIHGLILVWGVFMVGQTLESFFITPYLVGERIGLSPMAVIFALMAFGQLMGFVGILLALPMAAIVLVLNRYLLQFYFTTAFYQRKIDE